MTGRAWCADGIDITEYGDSALLVRARHGDEEQRWHTVRRLAAALTNTPPTGIRDLVTTYDCLLVEFDCGRTAHDAMARAVQGAAACPDADAGRESRVLRIPVVYGGAYGPDLPDVADQLGMTEDEVVRLHHTSDWVVRFLGAPAGAPMLDGVVVPTPIRRHSRPRPMVPAGSVALAGRQGVIYPVSSPGGWRLIGRTPLRLVDSSRWPHVTYRPGDRFRFEPIETFDGELADYGGQT